MASDSACLAALIELCIITATGPAADITRSQCPALWTSKQSGDHRIDCPRRCNSRFILSAIHTRSAARDALIVSGVMTAEQWRSETQRSRRDVASQGTDNETSKASGGGNGRGIHRQSRLAGVGSIESSPAGSGEPPTKSGFSAYLVFKESGISVLGAFRDNVQSAELLKDRSQVK